MPTVDLAVVGGGPTGRAIAARAQHHNLSCAVIDPSPDQAWPATYGAFWDELPAWFPPHAIAATIAAPTVWARTVHQLTRPYSTFITSGLQRWLREENSTVVDVCGAALSVVDRGTHATVVLRGGETLDARMVIDTSGASRVVCGGPPPGLSASQTAVGIVLPQARATTFAFMDWRDDHGERGWPSFLYAVPLANGDVLYEETSLARRPGLDLAVLRRRLHARLAQLQIDVPAGAVYEHVWFAVDTPRTPGTGRVVPFGAAAPLVHPATGYGLATAFRMVDGIIATISAALPDGRQAAEAARQLIWSPGATVVHHLRRRGLEAVLALPPAGVIDFFELFFCLPPHHQRAYLSVRDDPVAVGGAMWALFRAADGPLRRHLLRWGVPPIGDHRAVPAG